MTFEKLIIHFIFIEFSKIAYTLSSVFLLISYLYPRYFSIKNLFVETSFILKNFILSQHMGPNSISLKLPFIFDLKKHKTRNSFCIPFPLPGMLSTPSIIFSFSSFMYNLTVTASEILPCPL